RPALASTGPTRTISARKLMDHNVFDHTVDLDPPPEPEPEPEDPTFQPKNRLDLSDPLAAEPCEGVAVDIVTESDDPTWSIAGLQAPGEDRAALRRVGDVAGDFEVAYIGFNRIQASPAVWLVKEKTKLCQALLFVDEQAAKAAAAKTDAKAPPTPAPPPAARRGAPTVPKDIADKIEKVSGTEYNVDRAVVDNILENQAELMRSARIVPEKGADGKTVGIRLFGIRPDTLLGSLGLQNGD